MQDVLTLASEGRAEELRCDLRRRALSSLYFFTKVICGYNLLVPHFHMPLCNDIQNTVKIRKRGYLWPRKHFKTTVIGKSYPHWRLCGGGQLDTMPELLTLEHNDLMIFYTMYPERDPRNLRIGIVGESQDIANKDLKDIKHRTEKSDMFRWLFPELIPEDVNKTKWTESEILLPRSKSFDESTIRCIGIDARGTGFHYDMLIYDDIVGETASQSDPEMERALEWLRAAPGLLNDDLTGEELIAGTRWRDGVGDVYGWLMKHMPYCPAVVSDEGAELVPATGFKFSTQSCYFEPTKEIRFKERFNTPLMEEIRKRAGDYLFNCNYRNTPTPKEGSKLAHYKFYDILPDGDGLLRIAAPRDGSPICHINQMARLSFLDPSSGGRAAKCENAIVIIGTDRLNRHFVIDFWSANTGYSGAIERWHELNDKYVCWKNAYEQVGSQKEIPDIVSIRQAYGTCILCQKKHRALAPQGCKPPTGIDKNQRIELFLEPAIREGRFYVREDQAELCRQLDMFPHGDLVDVADATAWGVHESIPFVGFEELMDARDLEKAKLASHTPRCAGSSATYGGYA
jgi:hypothetical protein